VIPVGVMSDLLERLERMIAAGGGHSHIYVRTGGAYYQITGWVCDGAAFYLRTKPVLADDVDPAGLISYDGD
jgi:hypothetical protein